MSASAKLFTPTMKASQRVVARNIAGQGSLAGMAPRLVGATESHVMPSAVPVFPRNVERKAPGWLKRLAMGGTESHSASRTPM